MQNPLTEKEVKEELSKIEPGDVIGVAAFTETVIEHLGVIIPEKNKLEFMKLLMAVCINYRVLRERRHIKYN